MLLLTILGILIFGILSVLCINSVGKVLLIEIKLFVLILTLGIFFLSLFLWLFFENNNYYPQFFVNFTWFETYDLNFLLGIDGYSLFLVILTTFIIPICVLTSWNVTLYLKNHLLCFLFIEFFLILAFTALDLFLFFIIFEGVLVPIFLLIGVWGHRVQKIKAAYYFFLYTFVGSVFLLFAILILYINTGTTNYYILSTIVLPFNLQLLVWICLFIPFIIKIPVLPFHIWLPEAHVEAPTSGSIILAALLLKLGLYGFLRSLIPFCPDANLYFLPMSCTLLIVSLMYTSFTTLRQVDLKRIIAYSSITHINFAALGLLSFNYYSIQGAIVLIIAHGFVSTGLFFLIGVLYDRTHTRLLDYYSGLVVVIPVYSFFLFTFCLANFGLPITFNFVGEFLIIVGLTYCNFSLVILTIVGVFCSAAYSIWLFNRLVFGNLKLNYINTYIDLSRLEVYLLSILIFYTLFFGLAPTCFLDALQIKILINKKYFFIKITKNFKRHCRVVKWLSHWAHAPKILVQI
jgi:proton-translocating NADH-quinone oxidoreductase chain M